MGAWADAGRPMVSETGAEPVRPLTPQPPRHDAAPPPSRSRDEPPRHGDARRSRRRRRARRAPHAAARGARVAAPARFAPSGSRRFPPCRGRARSRRRPPRRRRRLPAPRGAPRGRRRAARAARRADGQPLAGRRRPPDARDRRGLLHDRVGRPRGERRRRARRCDRRDPALLHYRSGAFYLARGAPQRRAASATASSTSRSASPRRATSRSPAAGTRSSATPTSPSSRRPRRSPATCPARSASPGRSAGSAGLPAAAAHAAALAATTPSSSPRSATRRRTTPPRPGRSTPPAGRRTRASRCRCCSSARTTAWASRPGRRPAGSQAMFGGRPGLEYRSRRRHRPARDRCDRRARPPSRPRPAAPGAAAPAHACGSAGTPAPTSRRLPQRRARSPTTSPATRSPRRLRAVVARRGAVGRAGARALARRSATGRRRRGGGPRAARAPRRLSGDEQVMAPIAPRRPEPVAALRRPRAGRGRGARGGVFGDRLPEDEGALTLAQAINRTLLDAGACARRTCVVLGEDVAPQGRRLRRDPRAAAPARGVPGDRHRARRADGARDGARRRASAGCCRCRRSSTWPTCTTPRTSCAARPRRCSSSPRAPTATRSSSGCRGWPTRRASAATSTTTTGSACSRDIPGLVVACPAHPSDAPGDAAHLPGRRRGRRHGERGPRADRALPRARHARRGRRWRGSPPTPPPHAWAMGARPDRARARPGAPAPT